MQSENLLAIRDTRVHKAQKDPVGYNEEEKGRLNVNYFRIMNSIISYIITLSM